MKKITLALLLVGAFTAADAKDHPAINTSLNAVRAQPDAWLGTEFYFTGRYHGLGEVYQPFYTQFDAYSFGNFAAWDASLDLSVRENFLDHCPTLYISRQMNAGPLKELAELNMYQRFRAKAAVRSVFAGRAFIEVMEVTPLDVSWCPWAEPVDHMRTAMGPQH